MENDSLNVCKDCDKKLDIEAVRYTMYKYGYLTCLDCSTMTGYNKPNTKEQTKFLKTNSIDNIPF